MIDPTIVRIAKRLVGAELEARAGIHRQVAHARQQMLEEGPGQADQHDEPDRAARGLGELGISVGPIGDAISHQVSTARPAMARAAPVTRWRIETSMCGPHRQTVRWGESGRDLWWP